MIPITDGRILNAISRRDNIIFDKKFKYALKNTEDIDFKGITYKNKQYKLKYVSGCFYPFLYEI